MGLHHEKLFYALKHSEEEDYKHIMKRFYPEKYKKVCATPSKASPSKQNENPIQLTEADPQSTNGSLGVKRRLSLTSSKEKENRMNAKRSKKEQTISVTDEPSTLSSANLSNKVAAVPDPKGVKKVLICQICPPGQSATYNTDQLCRGHMAEAHFQAWILAQYPAKGSKCGFPDCSVTLHSAVDRAKHLGLRHKQVLVALQSHLLVSTAKEEALKRLQANEKQSVIPNARDQTEQPRPLLRSGSLSEVLGSLQPQKSSSAQGVSKDKDEANNRTEGIILKQTTVSTMETDEPDDSEIIFDVDAISSSKEGDEKTCMDCGGWLKVRAVL